MAKKVNIGVTDDWFVGEDKTLQFEVFDTDGVTMLDVTGFAFRFVLRRQIDDDEILLDYTTASGEITITGTFNATRATNTQRIAVAVADTDTDSLEGGKYQFALKRTDAGSETIYSYGDVHLQKVAL